MYELKRSMYVETAHFLRNHPGLCAHVHGHSYKISVTVESESLDHDMVMDFSDLKGAMNKIVGEFDHVIVIDAKSYKENKFMEETKRFIVMENRPTAERMARYFFDRLKHYLPEIAILTKVTVRETRNNEASYYEI